MSTTAAFIAGVVVGGLLLTLAGFISGEIKGFLKHKRQTAHTILDTRQFYIPTDADMPDIASFEIPEIEEIEEIENK